MSNPTYHLRPQKAVDRNLFIELLLRLRKIIDLSEYRYIGFGSYEFDEFKLVYRALGIEDLHSIEVDYDVYKRQIFNKPYSCIELFNKTCKSYFDEDYDESKQSIIWADFSDANEKRSQCIDITNICSKLKKNDILRITLNAHTSVIPTGTAAPEYLSIEQKKEYRFGWLKEHLGEEYFPDETSADDITNKHFPDFLLKVIKRAIYKGLNSNLVACPLCCYVYSDSMQMMTVTFLICTSSTKEDDIATISTLFKNWIKHKSRTRIINSCDFAKEVVSWRIMRIMAICRWWTRKYCG